MSPNEWYDPKWIIAMMVGKTVTAMCFGKRGEEPRDAALAEIAPQIVDASLIPAIQELRAAWKRRDRYWFDYYPTIHAVLLQEAQRRGIVVPDDLQSLES